MVETDSWIQSRESLSLGGTCFQSSSVKSATCLKLLLPSSTTYSTVITCHYVLRLSLSTLQNFPPSLNYGWESSGKAYLPIHTDELPAPLALIELCVCSCKTKCATRCKCRENALQCMDMCKCVECENDDAHGASDNDLKYDISLVRSLHLICIIIKFSFMNLKR